MAICKHYIVGVSVGVMAHPSTIAVIEQESSQRDAKREITELRLRHLERLPLSASYPALAKRLRAIRDGLLEHEQASGPEMIADITGTGTAVYKYFNTEDLNPIQTFITAGSGEIETSPRKWRVSRCEMVGALQVNFHSERFTIASALDLAPALTEELTNFKMKAPASGGDDLEAWRAGASDDLVLATALAGWWAERDIPVAKATLDKFCREMDDFYSKWAPC